jgi:hypothetical protein
MLGPLALGGALTRALADDLKHVHARKLQAPWARAAAVHKSFSGSF